MFKKTAIAALVLGFSGAASAAMYAPAPAPACSAGNVTVPCERSAWDLGVDGLYLRSTDNDNSATLRAKQGWGYRVEGSFHFGTGNDASLSWAYFKKDTPSTLGNNNRTDESRFNVVNFELGQHVDLGESFDVRFHGGVQYFQLKDNRTNVDTGNNNLTTHDNHKLDGFGPRAGVNMTYDFGNGFGLFGNSAMALVASKFSDAGTTDANGAAQAATKSYTTALSTDMQAGVKYTHAMAQGDLTARLGWTTHRVAQKSDMVDQSWNGVFVGLKWVGNA